MMRRYFTGFTWFTWPAWLVASVVFAACIDTDPVHTDAVNALGGEYAGIPQGEYHRAGQPCLVCHGGEGPASGKFVIAGTVFFGPSESNNAPPPIGVDNVQVSIEDDGQSVITVQTNCVGNFWSVSGDWTPGHPQFPLIVRIVGDANGQHYDVPMTSHVGRDGSCASCHQLPDDTNFFRTPGIVHLSGQDNPNFKGDNCPVSPVPPQFAGP
jgi:hypothetical protein